MRLRLRPAFSFTGLIRLLKYYVTEMLHVALSYGNWCLWGVQCADQNRFILLATTRIPRALKSIPLEGRKTRILVRTGLNNQLTSSKFLLIFYLHVTDSGF